MNNIKKFEIKYIPIRFLVKIQDFLDWESLLRNNFKDRNFPTDELLKIKDNNLSLKTIGKTIGIRLSYFAKKTHFDYGLFLPNKIIIHGETITDEKVMLDKLTMLKLEVENFDWESLAEFGNFDNGSQVDNFLRFINQKFCNKQFSFFDEQRIKNLENLLVFKNRFLTENNLNQKKFETANEFKAKRAKILAENNNK